MISLWKIKQRPGRAAQPINPSRKTEVSRPLIFEASVVYTGNSRKTSAIISRDPVSKSQMKEENVRKNVEILIREESWFHFTRNY